MVTVETIDRIRRAFLVDHKPIRHIVRAEALATVLHEWGVQTR
jgi:hypothetical protein